MNSSRKNDHWQEFPSDYGSTPYMTNIEQEAAKNRNFRTALWTGCHLQMTLMCIPPCEEIGPEIHQDTDQLIRIEQGMAAVQMGKCFSFDHAAARTPEAFLNDPRLHPAYVKFQTALLPFPFCLKSLPQTGICFRILYSPHIPRHGAPAAHSALLPTPAAPAA